MNECRIVQDLLPLYAENLVSQETKEFVDSHCEKCGECRGQRDRMCANLNQEETSVDYKKNIRRSVLRIVVETLLVSLLAVGTCMYGLWEWGFLDKMTYTAPDGNYRFQVVDCDAGLFDGGACIITPEGKDVNLYGDHTYKDFEVWYHPDGKGYFACITYDDHQDTWLCLSHYDEELGMETNFYFPEGEIAERDFLAILRASEQGKKYLTEDAIITFDRWSEAGQFWGHHIYFNYEIPGGWFGEIMYDVVEQEVKDITCEFIVPLGYFSGAIVHENEIPTGQLP